MSFDILAEDDFGVPGRSAMNGQESLPSPPTKRPPVEAIIVLMTRRARTMRRLSGESGILPLRP